MLITDIKRVMEQISRDKGIEMGILIKTLEEALKSAARKKYGSKVDIEAQYNEQTGEVEIFQFKEVVENIEEPDLQITLEEGRKLDVECEVGDSLGTKMDANTFGRIAAQSAKQVIIQKMKDAEKKAVYSSFIDRKGEIINGIVQRIDRRDIIVNIGNAEAILPAREQIPREAYRRGDRIRANIIKVLPEARGPQVVLSRTHPDFITNLFKTEVPEISEGIVKIMGAAREAGSRAKIAVSTSDIDIDPVGACVGMKGSRVQNVVQELRGEKIDIVSWHIDHARYICNALSPAEIARVVIDEEEHSMEVIVPDDSLSIAIGKRGQNVRLASKLTGWSLDVQSETDYSRAMKEGFDSLLEVEGVNLGMADMLYEKGFFSAEELSNATVEDLTQLGDISEEKATSLIENARLTALEVAEEQETDENQADEPENSDEEPVADENQADEPEQSDGEQVTDENQADEPENSDEEPVADENQADEPEQSDGEQVTDENQADEPENSDEEPVADENQADEPENSDEEQENEEEQT